MRRKALAFVVWSLAHAAAAQTFLPLSRVVETPYRGVLHKYRNTPHTAIRPYLEEDLRALPGADTLLPRAHFPWLDSLATRGPVTWGPLVDATAGVQNNADQPMTHRLGAGLWATWKARPNLTLHADGQYLSQGMAAYLDTLFRATRATLGEGYAHGDGPFNHFDWNAYASLKVDRWFNFTLGRGKHFLGEGYRSLLLSDNATSYPYFKLTATFWHVRYMVLFAQLNDIRGAAADPADRLKKFASFHYLSWNASKRLNFAVFEAVVWQDNDPAYPRGFDINYLNPAVFLRPVEFSIGSPDNALLGFAANVLVGNHTKLYGQVVLDEFLTYEVRAGNGWFGNKQAFQLGAVAYEAFKVKGLMVRGEFNYVRPFMYTHSDTRQNYSHFGQPLAHPYGSNFREVLVQTEWRRGRWDHWVLGSMATLGSDTGAYSYGNNIFRPESDRPLRDPIRRENYGFYVGHVVPVQLLVAEVGTGWLIDPRTGLRLEAAYLFRTRTTEGAPDQQTHWFRVGLATNLRSRDHLQEVRYVLH
ncbi:MAG: hypothetical protein JNM31_03755 [Flavobacteriales bacterium]|nr:hypothetical protein [Flavobacteriales bacterium]